MLYRLSYFRFFVSFGPLPSRASHCTKTNFFFFQTKIPFFKVKARSVSCRAFSGRRWIRTTEGKNQQIYSLPHLATLVFSKNSLRTFEPMEGIEPTTPRLQITCSGQLSYIGNIVFSSRSGSLFPKGIAKVGIFFNSPKLFRFFCQISFFLQQTPASVSRMRVHILL